MFGPLGGEPRELEDEVFQEGRVPFERSSLDYYRASFSPSITDELRAVIHDYAEKNTLRLCRRGMQVHRADGSSYRVACGNVWACPLCSPKRLTEYEYKIAKVMQSARTVLYLTFTVAHSGRAPEAGGLKAICNTWSAAFTTGSWMSDFRERTGMTGWLRSIEVTFPEGGFHPHIHAVMLFSSKPDQNQVDEVVRRWVTSAGRLGYSASLAAQDGRYVPRGSGRESIAFYLCEQTATRRSKGGKGRTPGDLLHSFAETGDADDLNALLGFHSAVAGKRKISTSRGFWSL